MFGKGVWHQGDAKTGIDHGGHQRGGGQLTNNIGGEACQVEAVHDRIIKGGGTVYTDKWLVPHVFQPNVPLFT